MTANPERAPSSRPLSPDELAIETSLLIDQDNRSIAELDELCRQHGQAMTGPPAEELSKVATEQLYQEIATKNPKEEFATLETLYGTSYTSIVNRII